mgnify:CR=1 FL=1
MKSLIKGNPVVKPTSKSQARQSTHIPNKKQQMSHFKASMMAANQMNIAFNTP